MTPEHRFFARLVCLLFGHNWLYYHDHPHLRDRQCGWLFMPRQCLMCGKEDPADSYPDYRPRLIRTYNEGRYSR